MESKDRVLLKYPDATVNRWGDCVRITRPRTALDAPLKLPFVSLSRLHYHESEAWDEAAKRIDTLL